jgi:hypothetical protein
LFGPASPSDLKWKSTTELIDDAVEPLDRRVIVAEQDAVAKLRS